MRVLTVCALLFAGSSLAKPWNGIDPGLSLRDDVIKKFGEPSRIVSSEGKDVLAYYAKQALKGTQQTQFRVSPQTQVVERIDVFPGPVVDRDAIESTYGLPCPASSATAVGNCYFKKLTDDFRTYFLYPKLGLAVFFNEDAKTVHSLIFQPTASPKSSGEAASPSSEAVPKAQ